MVLEGLFMPGLMEHLDQNILLNGVQQYCHRRANAEAEAPLIVFTCQVTQTAHTLACETAK